MRTDGGRTSLLQHDVDALIAVHYLGHTNIGGETAKRTCGMTVKLGARAYEIQHLPHAAVEVRIERHDDDVVGMEVITKSARPSAWLAQSSGRSGRSTQASSQGCWR